MSRDGIETVLNESGEDGERIGFCNGGVTPLGLRGVQNIMHHRVDATGEARGPRERILGPQFSSVQGRGNLPGGVLQ